MTQSYFFGYGSLVNRATHKFSPAAPAKIKGWRRCWAATNQAPAPFLSVYETPQTTLWGLVASVPNQDWAALDEREAGYDRRPARNVTHPLAPDANIEIYTVPATNMITKPSSGILRSYLDTVIGGFLSEFGHDGIAHFFDTTDGWEVGIYDDREAPRYPRYQKLDLETQNLVDSYLLNI